MLNEHITSEIKSISYEHQDVLKGDTPFNVIIESLAAQFDEYLEDGCIREDNENYIDKMKESISITEQIHAKVIEEFEVDDGVLGSMKDLFGNIILELMEAIGVDLSQVEDSHKLAYILYTNFMLVDQKQQFFNFVCDKICKTDEGLAAYSDMLMDKPEQMYQLIENTFDGKSELEYVDDFVIDCGFSDISEWIDSGFLPTKVLYDVFLTPKNFDVQFVTYYQDQIQ